MCYSNVTILRGAFFWYLRDELNAAFAFLLPEGSIYPLGAMVQTAKLPHVEI